MTAVVKDLLSCAPVCLNSSSTVAEALEVVLARDVREIYVTDDDGRLAGVVTDYELLKSQMTDTADARSVDAVMCRCPAVASAVEPVSTVAARFREARYAQMAVLDDGKFVGVICRHDIMRSIHAGEVLVAISESVPLMTPQPETARGPRRMQPASSALERLIPASV